MKKFCTVCDMPLRDGDKVAVVMTSVFRVIDSDVAYAVEKPDARSCSEIVHLECYDFPEQDGTMETEGIN